MNAFYEHHEDNIRFGYRCSDRVLLNGLNPTSPAAPSGWSAFSPPTAISTPLAEMYCVKSPSNFTAG